MDYIISDLDATFGKSGGFAPFWRITRSRNKPLEFSKSAFIKEVKHNRVYFAFHKKNGGIFENISVSDAKWIGELLSGLSRNQIVDAFRAANYDDRQVQILTNSVQRRISELKNINEEVSELR